MFASFAVDDEFNIANFSGYTMCLLNITGLGKKRRIV